MIPSLRLECFIPSLRLECLIPSLRSGANVIKFEMYDVIGILMKLIECFCLYTGFNLSCICFDVYRCAYCYEMIKHECIFSEMHSITDV